MYTWFRWKQMPTAGVCGRTASRLHRQGGNNANSCRYSIAARNHVGRLSTDEHERFVAKACTVGLGLGLLLSQPIRQRRRWTWILFTRPTCVQHLRVLRAYTPVLPVVAQVCSGPLLGAQLIKNIPWVPSPGEVGWDPICEALPPPSHS